MPARLGLDVDAVRGGALDGPGDLLSVVGADDGGGDDGDVEVVGLHPDGVVEGRRGEGDAADAAVAHGLEAGGERHGLSIWGAVSGGAEERNKGRGTGRGQKHYTTSAITMDAS